MSGPALAGVAAWLILKRTANVLLLSLPPFALTRPFIPKMIFEAPTELQYGGDGGRGRLKREHPFR